MKWTLKKMLHASAACIVFFCLATGAMAGNADVAMGQVVSVDTDKGFFTLQVDGPSGNGPQSITVVLARENGELILPDWVRPGEFVRVWGSYAAEDHLVFQAEVLRGARGERSDMSGVRSRLNMGMERGMDRGLGGGGMGSGRGRGMSGHGRK